MAGRKKQTATAEEKQALKAGRAKLAREVRANGQIEKEEQGKESMPCECRLTLRIMP